MAPLGGTVDPAALRVCVSRGAVHRGSSGGGCRKRSERERDSTDQTRSQKHPGEPDSHRARPELRLEALRSRDRADIAAEHCRERTERKNSE